MSDAVKCLLLCVSFKWLSHNNSARWSPFSSSCRRSVRHSKVFPFSLVSVFVILHQSKSARWFATWIAKYYHWSWTVLVFFPFFRCISCWLFYSVCHPISFVSMHISNPQRQLTSTVTISGVSLITMIFAVWVCVYARIPQPHVRANRKSVRWAMMVEWVMVTVVNIIVIQSVAAVCWTIIRRYGGYRLQKRPDALGKNHDVIVDL